MAKIITDPDGVAHLQGRTDSLCGEPTNTDQVTEGTLTCANCAKIALTAIETSTKSERREWRKL